MANESTKKAQILGQIFIFILAGLVFILIIMYGYKAINYFIERQEQVVLVDFKTDLEIAIEGVKRDYGTVRKVELKLSNDYLGVCFVDPVTCASQTPTLITATQIQAPWAQDSCQAHSANIVTIPRSQDIWTPDIQVDSPGYVCIPNTGKIEVRMEGTGKKTKISQWQTA